MLKETFKKIECYLFTIGFMVCLVSLMACKTDVAIKETPQAISGTGKILVLPFTNMSKVYGENVNVRCFVCGKVIMIGKIEDGVEHDLTERLFNGLTEKKGFQFIPPSQAEGVISELMLNNTFSWSEKDLILTAGRRLDADAVIYGYIYRYTERVGTEYSVQSPASVAFDIHLIHVNDGRLLWNGHFDETQQSLSENLLKLGSFIKRKGRWISAREMAIAGIEDVLKTFPEP
ncbi:MAG: hypothetical protein JSW04_12580 [Desulfobacterales bacterium]|nr:MAG: hypothetical protein JSV38_11520 [Desulfobacterales bacterium]UCD89244.1 MAG: hypothetical protein JSW04_12580 [Desulfobacterales bacterium]